MQESLRPTPSFSLPNKPAPSISSQSGSGISMTRGSIGATDSTSVTAYTTTETIHHDHIQSRINDTSSSINVSIDHDNHTQPVRSTSEEGGTTFANKLTPYLSLSIFRNTVNTPPHQKPIPKSPTTTSVKSGGVARVDKTSSRFCTKRGWEFVHFGFLFVNSLMTLLITHAVHENEGYLNPSRLYFSKTLSLFSFILWTYVFLLMFHPIKRFNDEILCRKWLRMSRSVQFWIYFFAINVIQLCLWMTLIVIYWDGHWGCTNNGQLADINPFKSDCDKLTNIWLYAEFMVFGIIFNFYLAVQDEMAAVIADVKSSQSSFVEMVIA